MNILIGCEESQEITFAFRCLGFNAFSCDVVDCSGGFPEWHIKCNVLDIINGHCFFYTSDSAAHYIKSWDLIIAHPPCTYLSKAGARWLYSNHCLNIDRYNKGLLAKDFFLKIYNCNCNHICIENPTPLKIFDLPKEKQVIQPYFFGDHFSKRTLLWLKNLPLLFPTNIVDFVPFCPSNCSNFKAGKGGSYGVAATQKKRSKTFFGFANALAAQWSKFILNNT